MTIINLIWSDSHSDGTRTEHDQQISTVAVPRVGETVHVEGVVRRKVEDVLYFIEPHESTVIVRLTTGYR